jgi:TolB-like protein
MQERISSMKYSLRTTLPFIMIICLNSCGIKPTVFLHPEYNFQFLERVAVIPFENLSNDQGAGARITQILLTELLAAKAFEVVEPGEVSSVLEKHSLVRTSALTEDQIISIGKDLRSQGLILGSVMESTSLRTGGSSSNAVTLVVRIVETETGATVWSATHSETGRGFWSSLFGTGGSSQSKIYRECVKKIIRTLIK